MATKVSTIEYIEDQLADLEGIRSQKMFGEYALYFKDKVVVLVCDDTLFIKITTGGKAFALDHYEEECPYPGAKPWIMVNEDLLEEREWLTELIEITYAELPLPKLKKRH